MFVETLKDFSYYALCGNRKGAKEKMRELEKLTS